MSEFVADTAPSTVPPVDSASAGNLLRQAREAAGLHIGALAVSLKVPVRKLEALEADQFDSLPDMVFVRALASSVCRTLRMDPAPILAKLPTTRGTPSPHAHSMLNAPLRSAGYAATGVSRAAPVSRPIVLAVGALLLGALVLFAWPYLQTLKLGQLFATNSESPVTSTTQGELLARTPTQVTETVQPALPTGAIEPTGAKLPTTLPAAAVIGTPTASPTTALVGTPALSAASGLVVFTVKIDTWVEVTDARGAISLRRLIPAGETVAASGNLPLAVTVGRANTTRVTVRGQPFDLAPVSRDNVARFQVK